MRRREFLQVAAIGGVAIGVGARPALAQTSLRLHGALPPPSTIVAGVIQPYIDNLAAASDGELQITRFDAMSLGGRPPEVYDQVRDGVVDMGYTLPGYTPGRFIRSEVFELPFMMTDPVATSKALNKMVEEDFHANDFKDVKILGAFVHGPGVLHSSKPITALEDMSGLTLRAPSRLTNALLAQLGSETVGMPVPAVPEALSKGVIDGAVVPWEITRPLRMSELVGHHTELAGPEALYTATFIVMMNKASYDALPDELRAVVDAESGEKLSELAGQAVWDGDGPARAIAVERGNEIIQLDAAETARWKAAAQPVVDNWVAEMAEKDIDGQALIDRARALIAEYSA